MAQQNDSTRWIRRAPEASWGALPTYLVAITQAGGGGTFLMTVDGQVTTALAFNISLVALQAALVALSTVGAGGVVVSGNPGNWILTFVGDNQGKPVSADFSLITGSTTKTLTGGPVWTVMKVTKAKHKLKTNVVVDDEIRNGPDMEFEDSVTTGGQFEDWEWEAGVRADQLGNDLAQCGFADTKTTHAGESAVYDHAMKPATAPNYGKSYTVQMYNGQTVYMSRGVVGTELKITGKAGENAEDAMSFKGWGIKAGKLATVPTITLPSNTTYRKTKATNSGRAIAFSGGAANSLLSEFSFAWKRAAKPFYTQTGTVDPYRPSYGKRELEVEATMIYDDTTELDQARSVPAPSRSFQATMPHTENAGTVPTKPSVTLNSPALIWMEPDVDPGDDSTVVKLGGGNSLYNTAAAAQAVFTIVNEDNTQYA